LPTKRGLRLVSFFVCFKNYYLETSVKKFTLVATAVASLVSTSVMAQSTVTIYGIMDAGYAYTTNQSSNLATTTSAGSKHAIESGQIATSRWGIKGSEDLGGGMKANFGLESTISGDTGATGNTFGTPAQATMFDRQATVGLSGGFGSLNLGRQNNLAVDAGVGDPTGFAHPGTNPNVFHSALNNGTLYGAFGANGGSTAFRQNNSVKYLTPDFSGFGGGLMYAFGEQGGSTSKNSYAGILGNYANGPLAAALTYAKLKDANDVAMTVWGGSAKYSLDAFTLKGSYAQNKVDSTTTITTPLGISNRKIVVTGLGLDYAVSPALTLTGAFYNTKRTGIAAEDGTAKQYVAIGKYALSKRTSLYSSLTHFKASSAATIANNGVLLNANAFALGSDSANRFSFGVTHAF
jgi:general bacterial porin, GBP family